MTTLAAQQRALLDALFAWPPQSATNSIANYVENPWTRGLQAYQSNGHALAERALQAAYPVLNQLLGDESLSALARVFWHEHPPHRGDLAQWGAGLSDFVRASEQLADEPYLADVISVEWALHLSTGAPNHVADVNSFALLMQHEPEALHLRLAPACAVVQSQWPVASIVMAHLGGGPTLEEVGQRLRAGTGECAVVWRQGIGSRVAPCSQPEAQFLQAVLLGATLSSALANVDGFQFDLWLPAAVQSGVVVGVSLCADHAIPETP